MLFYELYPFVINDDKAVTCALIRHLCQEQPA